ncbi:MAG: HPr family phosphocarrier protein [Candidatus Competibacteraceae bacterium]
MSPEVDKDLTQASDMAIISDHDFAALIAGRACRLLMLARYFSAQHPKLFTLTRPVVADLLSQSTQLEELLDAYGARNNRQWSRFRSLIATIKLFADVSYKLLHIQHFLPCYRLLPIEQDFATATANSLECTCDVLVRATHWLIAQASRLGLSIPADKPYVEDYAEHLPRGRLPHDQAVRKLKSASEIVTYLATAYLNLAAESKLLYIVEQIAAEKIAPSKYSTYFPDLLREDSLRYLQFRFHTLQALYDTHVSETEIECLNTDLPILRSHISVVFHLLEIATQLAHYYERHLNVQTGNRSLRRKPVITADILLEILINYAIMYAWLYLDCGRRLCHTMLRLYAKVGKIAAPVPSYRGFHVRPATLIARIVQHYGSDVQMELDGQSYDASSPLDIFRANEKINAQKRRWLVSEIGRLPLPEGDLSDSQLRATIMNTVLKLAEQGKIIIYQKPFELSEELNHEGMLLERIIIEIVRLQTTGKLDIKTELNIAFVGDKRVLSDLALLAKSGYGEDDFGNNIALPKQLAYLRNK